MVRTIFFALLFAVTATLISSCSLPQGPDQRSREMNEEKAANKQSTDFAHNALPPVQNGETPLKY